MDANWRSALPEQSPMHDPLICIIELAAGETPRLPPSLLDRLGPGRWLVSIASLERGTTNDFVRNHRAFLNGYSRGDEGLYDDLTAR